MEEWRDMR
jgi:hypothetical protein